MPSVNESAPGTFSFPVRVYYEDTDTAGVVYYAGYLRFLERGRTEWLRALGVGQFRLAQEAGIVFAVRSLNIEYLKPARLDDVLDISAWLSDGKRVTGIRHSTITRAADNALLARASALCVCANLETGALMRWPENVRSDLAPNIVQ